MWMLALDLPGQDGQDGGEGLMGPYHSLLDHLPFTDPLTTPLGSNK